jgi:hypothetical protein
VRAFQRRARRHGACVPVQAAREKAGASRRIATRSRARCGTSPSRELRERGLDLALHDAAQLARARRRMEAALGDPGRDESAKATRARRLRTRIASSSSMRAAICASVVERQIAEHDALVERVPRNSGANSRSSARAVISSTVPRPAVGAR